mmetsp:Transcript_39371/g.71375  ORF Transcript_39371/g.71375 Transcript_39371/m.71375 type:complete len:202 (+) Transcript_39371:424-1029(+)
MCGGCPGMSVLELLKQRHLDQRKRNLSHGRGSETCKEAPKSLGTNSGDCSSEGQRLPVGGEALHPLLQNLTRYSRHAGTDVCEGSRSGISRHRDVLVVLQSRGHPALQEMPGRLVHEKEYRTAWKRDQEHGAEPSPRPVETASSHKALRGLHARFDGIEWVQRYVDCHSGHEACSEGEGGRRLTAKLPLPLSLLFHDGWGN